MNVVKLMDLVFHFEIIFHDEFIHDYPYILLSHELALNYTFSSPIEYKALKFSILFYDFSIKIEF